MATPLEALVSAVFGGAPPPTALQLNAPATAAVAASYLRCAWPDDEERVVRAWSTLFLMALRVAAVDLEVVDAARSAFARVGPYFVKFVRKSRVRRRRSDDPLVDNVTGGMLAALPPDGPLAAHVMKYVGSFVTPLSDGGETWPVAELLDASGPACAFAPAFQPDARPLYYASVFEAVKGGSVLFTSAGSWERGRVLAAVPALLRALRSHGAFMHNDLHLGNVFLTSAGTLTLIDYGRCVFLSHMDASNASRDADDVVAMELQRNRGCAVAPCCYADFVEQSTEGIQKYVPHHLHAVRLVPGGRCLAPVLDLMTFCMGLETVRKANDRAHVAFDGFLNIGADPEVRGMSTFTVAGYREASPADASFDAVIASFDAAPRCGEPDVAVAEGLLYSALYLVFVAHHLRSQRALGGHPFREQTLVEADVLCGKMKKPGLRIARFLRALRELHARGALVPDERHPFLAAVLLAGS